MPTHVRRSDRSNSPTRSPSGLVVTIGTVIRIALWLGAITASEPVGFDRCRATPAEASEPWSLVPIPESWKSAPPSIEGTGVDPDQAGYAWYRAEVVVPAAWTDRPLHLFVEPVDDARGVFVNGVQVGASGTFPPRYRSGLGEGGRHRLPDGLVRADRPNTIAVRVYYNDGRNNFAVAAPVLYDAEAGRAIRMEGDWQSRLGDDPRWADGPIGEPSARFDRVETIDDLDMFLRRRQGDRDPLPPEQALARFRTPDDLNVDLVLAEPIIAQPLHISFDARGRLWLVEYRQYPEPAGLNSVSRDKYLRTVYDAVPEPPPHGAPGRDRISIHEDTDGDGTYDRHTVFVDGLNLATSVAVGRGGVWVLNPPYLLFYPDLDGDDVPDGDPVVHLQGFGLEDTHSICNSLRFGPDGWLYAAQGSTVSGRVRRPDQPETEAVDSLGQLIWRYHPESQRYEIFAEGGGNTFGVEIDARGRTYSGHNGGNTRGFHYVQGGYYQKGFSKHGSLSNPYAFGYFPWMTHHDVPRFTHNVILYESNAFPEPYRNQLFGIEPLQGQVVRSRVTPDGSTFETSDVDRPLTTDDPWFRPVDIKLGPDGAIYLADFYEQRIDHSSHYAGRIDRTNGRVYRIRSAEPKPRIDKPFNLRNLSSDRLLKILDHPNRWIRHESIRVLGDRRDPDLIPTLLATLQRRPAPTHALERLWALHLCGGLDEPTVLSLLDHPDPHVRLWSARLACDDGRVDTLLADALAVRAAFEPNVEVRSQLACSARRLPTDQALPIVRALLTRDEDRDDPHIPLLLWWALETQVRSDPDAVLALFDDEPLWSRPLVSEHILSRLIRRFGRAGRRPDLLICARLLDDAPDEASRSILMAGLEEAWSGRAPSAWPEPLVRAVARAGGGSLALRLRQGEGDAVVEALAIVDDPTQNADRRLALIATLAEAPDPRSVATLLGLVVDDRQPESIRIAAAGALRPYNDPAIARRLIVEVDRLTEDVLEATLTTIVGRRDGASTLLDALDAGRVDETSVPLSIARRIRLHDDSTLNRRVEDRFGPLVGASTDAHRTRIARLARTLDEAAGNPYDGLALFDQRCARCHRLFDRGGDVGPELTSYQRRDRDALLLAIVNPDAEVREGFETYLAELDDGRITSGFLVDRDDRVVVLRGADGQNQVLDRREVLQMRAIPQSVMPSGLLDDLGDQQVRDLFAYLRSSQPLNTR